MQTVSIRKGEKIVRINFMYNSDLVDIMRKYRGWFFRKEKAWQFPVSKLPSIIRELKENHYNIVVKDFKFENKPKRNSLKQTTLNYWSLPDVVSVYGECKKCGEKTFVNKEGYCIKCSINS